MDRWAWLIWALSLALNLAGGNQVWIPIAAFFLGLRLKERFGRSLYGVGQGIEVKWHRRDRFWRLWDRRVDDPMRIDIGGEVP